MRFQVGRLWKKKNSTDEGKRVGVLQQVTTQSDVTYTYFETEPEGKFALGLVYRPEERRLRAGPAIVSPLQPGSVGCRSRVGLLGEAGVPGVPDTACNPPGRTPATGTSRFCLRLRSVFSVTLSSATNGSLRHRARRIIYAIS